MHWGADNALQNSPPDWLNVWIGSWNIGLSAWRFSSLYASIIYVIVCISCVATIFLFSFLRSPYGRFFFGSLIFIGFFFELSILAITGSWPNYEITKTLVHNAAFGIEHGIVQSYMRQINLVAIAVAVPITIYIMPARLSTRQWPLFMIAAVSAAGVALIVIRTNSNTNSFPPPYSSYVNLIRTLIEPEPPAPALVAYNDSITSRFQKIVFVMDESVRGDTLSINGYNRATTPYLEQLSQDTLANQGAAVSATNCSIPTRLAIRHAIPQNRINESSGEHLKRTTIWQYAKHAGYRVVYFDAYGRRNLLSSNMTAHELSYIDERVTFEQQPVHSRDPKIAEALSQYLEKEEKIFIFIDKFGTHAPYDRMYPSSQNHFAADTSKPFSHSDVEEMIKHYGNAIKWSVDGFFEKLKPSSFSTDAILIYTSDHGQSLSEDGVTASHCTSGEVRTGELNVPLFVVSTNQNEIKNLKDARSKAVGHYNHFHIVPSILDYMGYNINWINMHHGQRLSDPAVNETRVLFGGRSVNISDSCFLPDANRSGARPKTAGCP